MQFQRPGKPLVPAQLPVPTPGPGQLLLRVRACGLCRTDLHLLDGEVDIPHPPRVLGHQIVGEVLDVGEALDAGGGVNVGEDAEVGRAVGEGVDVHEDPEHRFRRKPAPTGRLVGVPWLGWTCGECELCRCGRENLCPRARFTGRDIDGGMAQYALADERYSFEIPAGYPAVQAAPLLCAGLIGYRALRMCGDARRLGIYGFGAAAHIVCQVARWQQREVFAFTRSGDLEAQRFALDLGAAWAGDSTQTPPEPLDAAIVFAPDGALVPVALAASAPGATIVCGGIHMSQIPAFDYSLLWQERTLRSVANLTRRDGQEFLALAPQVPVHTHVTEYPLERANEALEDLRQGRFTGAAVLVPPS